MLERFRLRHPCRRFVQKDHPAFLTDQHPEFEPLHLTVAEIARAFFQHVAKLGQIADDNASAITTGTTRAMTAPNHWA